MEPSVRGSAGRFCQSDAALSLRSLIRYRTPSPARRPDLSLLRDRLCRRLHFRSGSQFSGKRAQGLAKSQTETNEFFCGLIGGSFGGGVFEIWLP